MNEIDICRELDCLLYLFDYYMSNMEKYSWGGFARSLFLIQWAADVFSLPGPARV